MTNRNAWALANRSLYLNCDLKISSNGFKTLEILSFRKIGNGFSTKAVSIDFCTASSNSFWPHFSVADMGTIAAIPRSFVNFSRSILISSFTISIIFKATTTGIPRAANCVVRYKWRLKFVASTTETMTPGGSWPCIQFKTCSVTIRSSMDCAVRLYVPGRSRR